MAARRRRQFHDDETRRRIKVSNIITYLQDHVEGTKELSGTQLKAAEILLRKALPDLSQVEHKGEVVAHYVLRAEQQSPSVEKWQAEQALVVH